MTGFRDGHYEGAGETKTVVVAYDIPSSKRIPAFRFPGKGRVLAAYFGAATSSSGTQLLQVQLLNGGVTGAGTIVTAPQTSGTVIGGSAYTLTVATGGPETYDTGEWVMLDVATTEPITGVTVQVDYWLNPVSRQ